MKTEKDVCIKKQENLYETDNELRWQFERCLLPKSQWCKHEMIIDENNEEDSKAYDRLADIKCNIKYFVKKEHINLYINSDLLGNGKTTWAIRLLQSYLYETKTRATINEQVTGLYISVPKLLADLKDFRTESSQQYISYVKDNIANVDLVVWDDIAIEEMSGYDRLQLYVFINDRIFAEQANIFTSNVALKELYKVTGRRIADRLAICEDIEFFGDGWR